MKTLLFIIDMQNDFCSPSGSLYVPGAEEDVNRLCNLMERKKLFIDNIILTQDNHQIMDIAHPAFWINQEGEHPAPFSNISYNDVQSGKWQPVIFKEKAVAYMKQLQESEEYQHTIWPEHCIWGSEGAAIYPLLMGAVENWARQGRMFEVVSKGTYPLTEHFGAFRANIPSDDVAETLFNTSLVEKMNAYDVIWIAGEAKSHCVANTVKQLFDYPGILQKSIILEDCMSNVVGSDTIALPIYEQAKELGVSFTKSTEIQ